MADELDATGLVTSVVGRGVTDGSGTQTAAIVLMQSNPTLTVLMDKRPASELLAGGVKAVKAFIPGKVTVTDHVLSGARINFFALLECHPARTPATSTVAEPGRGPSCRSACDAPAEPFEVDR
jgi:hypothetical protein